MVKTVLLSYFDMATKEFLQTRATVVDDSDHSVDYIPYDATEVLAPDKTTWPAHTYPVFNGTGWDTVPDYRGVTFYHHLTQETKEYGLGESPDTSLYTDVAPSDAGTIWNSSMDSWVHTVDGHKLSKRLELVKACNDAMYGSFNTGVQATDMSSHSQIPVFASIMYRNDEDEMSAIYTGLLNQAASISSESQDVVYKTADDKIVTVSPSKMEAILAAVSAEHNRICKRLSTLLAAVERAQTAEAIDAIVW